MGGPRDEVNRALAAAGATAGPSSWSEARASPVRRVDAPHR